MTEKLTTRAIAPRPSTIRDEDRSVEFVISSEEKAAVFDWERMDVVDEVLLQSGMRMPANKQVPLLDSHSRESVGDILGSMRDLRREGDVTVGRAYFSRKQKAYDAYQDVRDGHLDSVSVGYNVTESTFIPAGQRAIIENREYVGPLKVSTGWELREVSTVAIPADKNARVRTEPAAQTQEEKPTEPNGQSAGTEIKQEEPPVEQTNNTTTLPAAPDLEGARNEAIRQERERCIEIRSACTKANMTEKVEEFINSGKSADEIRKLIIDTMPTSVPISSARVEMGQTDAEKFNRSAVVGIMTRGSVRHDIKAEPMRIRSLLHLAEMCLERKGISTRGMSNGQIASAALRYSSRGAYQIQGTSDDFVNILLDASNKSMQQGFEEGPRLWKVIARAASTPDFKNINRISMFEAQDLAEIDEAGNYTEAKFNDGKETYRATSKGLRFTISRVAIINDDADAFSRVPRILGVSATRTIERAVFGLLTGGLTTTMSDGKALFHADHNNISTGAALSSDALGKDIVAMGTQKGRGPDGSTTPCGVIPAFSLVPFALKLSNETICTSPVDPTANAGHAKNPILSQNITPLASPFLDLSDATRRYLLADPNQYDTIEVAFLDGVQEPYMEEVDQTDADGRIYKVRMDVGAGVLDWRGLLTNAGK